jgi:ubiquinol-cytochrome c reductase cytochrome b subunit
VVEGLSEGGTRDAPKLFGWGSPRWVRRVILKPGAPDLYGYLEKKDQMPSFSGQATENDIETIVRYLAHDYPGVPGRPAPRR